MIAGAAFLIGVAFGLLGYAWITAPERRRRITAARRREWADAKREAELRRVVDQRDRYWRLYHDAVRTNAALLEHIGDERAAAAADALNDTPAYFEAKAAREAASIDREWLDLDMSEGGPS